MKQYLLNLTVVIALSIGSALAANTPAVTSVTVDYVDNKLTIDGSNFSPTGGMPTVTFAGNSELVLSYTNIEVVVSIPSNLAAGTYDLVMANSVAQNQTTNFSVTIGSSGPGSVSSLTFQQYCAIVPDTNPHIWGQGANNLTRTYVGCSKMIFITSQRYDGNLGGEVGANAKCQAAAVSQGFPGVYRAWLSDQIRRPSNEGDPRGPVVDYRMVDTFGGDPPVEPNYAGFFSGSLQAPITQSEFGTFIEAGQNPQVWTGFGLNFALGSTVYPEYAFGQNCVDWTSNLSSDQGAYGDARQTDGRWTFTDFAACNNLAHLYCLQQ